MRLIDKSAVPVIVLAGGLIYPAEYLHLPSLIPVAIVIFGLFGVWLGLLMPTMRVRADAIWSMEVTFAPGHAFAVKLLRMDRTVMPINNKIATSFNNPPHIRSTYKLA